MTDDQQPTDPTGGRRADRAGTTAPGRRGLVQARKLDVLVVLGVLLPLGVAGSLAVVDGDDPAPYPDSPPSSARLTDASLVCAASGSSTAGDVLVTRVPDMRGGQVAVRVADGAARSLGERRSVDVKSGRLTTIATDGDVVVRGKDAAAPGLVAGRTGEARAAAECRAPAFDEWYVGIGAAAKQSSTIELVNPDGGPAVVEIALYGRHGLVEEEELHGIQVPGNGVVRLDLSQVTPRRGTLAAHVTVVRGRVVTTVRHTYDPLGRGTPRIDFLPAQAEPSVDNLLLGVPADGRGEVNIFNPGDSEVRATVRVVSDSAVFTPAGLDDVVVPPGSVRQVLLSQVLTKAAREGALGLEVVAAQPVVTSVRLLGEDLGLIAPVVPIAEDEPETTIVPAGPKLLVLAGASGPGSVRITATDAQGKVLVDGKRVEIGADRGVSVKLPDAVVAVTVQASNTVVAAAIELTGDRVGVLRVHPAEVDAQVPVVRPE
ncbi:hypothetical protein F0U44_01645 [Nocardioides humilatus]|uniref:Secreted protein n=1 Tax=Nocardioides humilatus TaxID=2607660 RepID=A0A5B1LN70_9ACTN|nr:DUF5719 family protein [Nocardioides humilatus]KAA1421057.1 hypothetical protein F0U44_01645 [Nocardioides humilatus]